MGDVLIFLEELRSSVLTQSGVSRDTSLKCNSVNQDSCIDGVFVNTLVSPQIMAFHDYKYPWRWKKGNMKVSGVHINSFFLQVM